MRTTWTRPQGATPPPQAPPAPPREPGEAAPQAKVPRASGVWRVETSVAGFRGRGDRASRARARAFREQEHDPEAELERDARELRHLRDVQRRARPLGRGRRRIEQRLRALRHRLERPWPHAAAAPPLPEPAVTLRGPVPTRARDDLVRSLERVTRAAPRPVLHCTASLTRCEDPAVARGVTGKASLDVGGRIVRAGATTASEREAIGLLESRLHRSLRRLAEREIAHRRAGRPLGGP